MPDGHHSGTGGAGQLRAGVIGRCYRWELLFWIELSLFLCHPPLLLLFLLCRLYPIALLPPPSPLPSPQGPQPILYFCKYGGEVLRACAAGEAPIRNKEKVWGGSVKVLRACAAGTSPSGKKEKV